ncbi:type VII secretion target [Paractinoplanes lichenicola]|uniref:Uncharacterized protein n=1 Tax=Paractinoplanes lichenicola TaxID=2802976 RepID=A0ABS1VRA1_9ACTN|nr:type VII secretion target [Actinoplanes lichenicola]MBL7257243.1 hypothetical protein [Actinoplanes lichenicola]
MAEGFSVEAEQLRAHAAKLEALRQRVDNIKAASASIAADDAAFGLLCGWMADVLERRHQRQNQLFAHVEKNLGLAADALIRTGQGYADVDDAAAERILTATRTNAA